jgi:hypothetical protein
MTDKFYNNKFCVDCSKKELKFGLNIKYDEKDEYKKKYKVKWDCDNKMWYKITTLETPLVIPVLRKIVDIISSKILLVKCSVIDLKSFLIFFV